MGLLGEEAVGFGVPQPLVVPWLLNQPTQLSVISKSVPADYLQLVLMVIPESMATELAASVRAS